VLPAGTLAVERLRDANQAAQGSACGEVKVVAFHPSEKVPVLCVGTADRRIRLFNVSTIRIFIFFVLVLRRLLMFMILVFCFHPF